MLQIKPDELKEIRRILATLPPEAAVSVFGSRATGKARPSSDLDLCIDAGAPLTLAQQSQLSDALSASSLPYRVEIVDWQSISEEFRQTIKKDRQPI